jgi:hypothetical protein
MTHGRLHLDQVAHWADEPLLRAQAVPTGVHSHRALTVAELRLVVVRVTDTYDPQLLTAYRSADDAIAAAERIMALPDSRGIVREWTVKRR